MKTAEAIWYLSPIRDSASLERYRDALTTAIDALNYQLRHEHPLTNGDRIRAMVATDEGLAKVLLNLDTYLLENGDEFTSLYCDEKNGCITPDGDIICNEEMRTACIIKWLRQPAKEANHER